MGQSLTWGGPAKRGVWRHPPGEADRAAHKGRDGREDEERAEKRGRGKGDSKGGGGEGMRQSLWREEGPIAP